MKDSKLEKLVNVRCLLDNAYDRLIPGSIQTASQIQRQRLKDENLRDESFITGDGCVYNVENGKAVLYLTNTALNPILKKDNIADAVSQIDGNRIYKVKPNDFSLIQREAAKKNGGAKRYVLSGLRLRMFDDEFCSFEFDTTMLDKLNESQRALAEQIHGRGKQFVRIMEELNNAGQDSTCIFVLDPTYVRSITRDGPVARVGRLSGFNSCGDFYACDRSVGNLSVRVRGVRRE
jgi:hypothetical protein